MASNVFGKPFNEVTPEDVEALVANSIEESATLDFKRAIYASGTEANREFASDVAAFANHRGGAIILGVDEEKWVAIKACPFVIDDADDLRLQSVAASRTFPTVAIEVHPVRKMDGTGYLIVEVPPSTRKPHALEKGNALVYPRRTGTGTHYLAETELANAYRDRFEQGQTVRSRFDSLRDTTDVGEFTDRRGWLRVTVVPENAGDVRIDSEGVAKLRGWVSANTEPDGASVFRGMPQSVVGLRRVDITSDHDFDVSLPKNPYTQLFRDGSSSIAVPFYCIKYPVYSGEDVMMVADAALVRATLQCLTLAGGFASTHAAAFGDAVAGVEVMATTATYIGPWAAIQSGQPVSVESLRTFGLLSSQASITLNDLLTGEALASAARTVLEDVFHSGGVPDVPYLRSDGKVDRAITQGNQHPEFLAIAERIGIEIS